MNKITPQEFLNKQPNYPETKKTDAYYLGVANHLLELWEENIYFQDLPITLFKRIALNITAYFQDIISDAGMWRSFIDANRKLYGYSIPFHTVGETYVDYELNLEDIMFLIWYNISMLDRTQRMLYPHDPRILKLADIWFTYLNEIYDDSPVPEGFNIAAGLDFNDQEDLETIYSFGTWLFFHSYLLTPAFALTMQEIINDPEFSNDITALRTRIEEATIENPAGPLAFFISEWLRLVIEGKLPENKFTSKKEDKEYPYYQNFIDATDGVPVKYFKSYNDLNTFLIDSLGWSEGEEHLPILKDVRNITLFVNKNRGLLAAVNIAECISDPHNPFYDKKIASKDAINLLTKRGKCPVDLVKYACTNGYLPDAYFPGTNDHELVEKNWDFIARCYLQQYYRD